MTFPMKLTVLFVLVVFVMLDGTHAKECSTATTKSSSENCTSPSSAPSSSSSSVDDEPKTETTTLNPASTTPREVKISSEDDHTENVFLPTPLLHNTSSSPSSSKGRALNFTSSMFNNGVSSSSNTTASKSSDFDLSDVTINDDEDDMMEIHPKNIVSSTPSTSFVTNPSNNNRNSNSTSTSNGECTENGKTYKDGEKIEIGCDSVCVCSNGISTNCFDRCREPMFRKGKKIHDPLCHEKSTDDSCCSVLVCSNDESEENDSETETSSTASELEMCHSTNGSFRIGETFHKDCEETCTCEIGGKITCKPRCLPRNMDENIKCVEVQDPDDSCCKKLLCDVTLNDNESDVNGFRLLSAKYLNSSMVKLKFDPKLEENDSSPIIELSNDKNEWIAYKILPDGYLPVQEISKFIRLEGSSEILTIEGEEGVKIEDSPEKSDGAASCTYKGKHFELNEEYNDNCTHLCVCKPSGMACLKLNCPIYFGTDVLDSTCVEWETVPPNFVPSPPLCCPNEIRCKNNGSCLYQDEIYNNWQQIPLNVTSCEKRCYCEMGKVECQNICPPLTALPPSNLGCPQHMATVGHLPDDDCCKHWICRPQNNNASEGLNEIPGPPPPTKFLGPLSSYANSNQKNVSFNKNNNNNDFPFVINPSKNDEEEAVPHKPHPHPQPPVVVPQQIHIVGKGSPDEILNFVNNHPELSNYPSGSVLEIHKGRPPHSQLPPNLQNPLENHIIAVHPNVPHLIQQAVQQGPLNMGISLEQILEEIHKNQHQQQHQQPHHPLHHQIGLDRPNININNFNATSGHPVFNGFPPNFQNPDDITVHTLEALDAHTIRLTFLVPPVIVGLHGRVEVRYTHTNEPNPDSWELQVFAPPNDLIATPQLEFDLLDLKADTEYKIKITITLRDLHNTPTSRVYKIRTLVESTSSTLPPLIPIEPELNIAEINSTWVTAAWRKFSDYELQFIDGIQLRFKEIDGRIYAATPLIHRAVSSYTIENLKPNTKYEIGIYFIPFPGQTSELQSAHMAHFTTANEVDTYGFNVTLEIGHIKSTNVEISWFGVPYPEDKYVNIYRAIYQSDSGKEDQSTFKIAKRDSPTKTIISDLKPGTRYRLWLEVYLTNGKIKTSNVQDFITKPRVVPVLGSSTHDKLLSEEQLLESKGDYYAPLVIVAILAAIAIMSTLVLLLVLLRRHNQNKASITPPTRISQSAYDNPTYKVEIQQETMGL